MFFNVPISYQPLIYLFRRKFSTEKNLQLQLSKDIRYVLFSIHREKTLILGVIQR